MRYIAAYCRTASAKDSDPLAGVREQEAAIRTYARRRGLEVSEWYLDPGESGASLDRPGLRRLLDDCHAGKVKMVLTRDMERLSRREDQLLAILSQIVREDVRIEVCARDGRDPFSFRLAVWGAVAEYAEMIKRLNSNVRPRRSNRQ